MPLNSTALPSEHSQAPPNHQASRDPRHSGRRTRRQIALPLSVLILGSLLAAPQAAHADEDCKIVDDENGGQIVCEPGSVPCGDDCNGIGVNGHHVAPNYTDTAGGKTGRKAASYVKTIGLPIALATDYFLPPSKAAQGGLAAGDAYRKGSEHVNQQTVKEEGKKRAPSPAPANTATRAPKNTGPAPGPAAVDASKTDGKGKSDPINPFNGELVVDSTDLSIMGYGVPYEFRRVYRSRVDFNGSGLGFGWDHSLNRFLVEAPDACGQLIYSTGEARTITFTEATRVVTPTAPNTSTVQVTWASPPGIHAQLSAEGYQVVIFIGKEAQTFTSLTYTMTTPDGSRALFDSTGLLLRLEDATHHGLSIAWAPTDDGGYRITRVTNNSGREVSYRYDSAGHLVEVLEEAALGRSVTMTYEGDDLVSVTDANGHTEIYTYSSGYPTDDEAYVPEAELRPMCEAMCSATPERVGQCGAPDVCADLGAELRQTCHGSCGKCLLHCAGDCIDYCSTGAGGEACRNGVGAEPGCRKGCEPKCAENLGTLCQLAYEGKDSVGNDLPGQSPQAVCESCDEHCGNIADPPACGNIAGCIGKHGANVLGAIQCVSDLGLTASLSELTDFLVAVGAYIEAAPECAIDWVCGLFDADCFDCEFDSAETRWLKACKKNFELCCAEGENCAPESCNVGQTCEAICKAAFWGTESQIDSCRANQPEEGCPEVMRPQCMNSCTGACAEGCADDCEQGCYFGGCEAGCGATDGSCFADCDHLDYEGLCRDGCEAGCVEKGRVDGAARYGRRRDLNHNLLTAANGDGEVYLRNTYGEDPTSPSFDAVVEQTIEGHVVKMAYKDYASPTALADPPPNMNLVGGSASALPPGPGPSPLPPPVPLPPEVDPLPLPLPQPPDTEPTANALIKQYVDNLEDYVSVDICPTPCSIASAFPKAEWVPWGKTLLLMEVPAPGKRAVVTRSGGTSPVPPTILRFTNTTPGKARASIVAGPGKLPKLLTFKVQLVGAPGTVLFSWTGPDFGVMGSSSIINALAASDFTISADAGGQMMLYQGRPLALARLHDGACTAPFTASTNGAGQLAITPASACSGDLTVGPLATRLDDDALRAAIAAGDTSAIAGKNVFKASDLVPGRFVTRWRQAGLSGRFEMSLGAEDGAAPPDLILAAVNLVQSSPVFGKAPDVESAKTRPLYVFHVPGALHPPPSTDDVPGTAPNLALPVFDLADAFTPYAAQTGFTCTDNHNPGPARRGYAEGPRPASATVLVDAYGVAWTYYYDREGRTLREVGHSDKATTSYNYDAQGHLTGMEAPLGNRICSYYNGLGLPVETVALPQPGAVGPTQPIRSRWAYTSGAIARLATVFDPRDPISPLSSYGWDSSGRLISETNALGETTTIVPADHGGPASITTPDGTVTLFEYDDNAGAISKMTVDTTGPDPQVTEWSYFPTGQLFAIREPLGKLTMMTYQGAKLLTAAVEDTRGDGAHSEVSLGNHDGRTVWAISNVGTMSTATYSPMGYPRKRKAVALDQSAEDRVSCSKYGPDGRLLEEISSGGSRTKYIYDGAGRVVEVLAGTWPLAAGEGWDPECAVAPVGQDGFSYGTIRHTTYDQNGRPVRVTDATGNETTIEYDGFGRVARAIDSSGSSARFGYDAVGNVVWQAAYDKLGSPTSYGPPQWGQPGLMAAASARYDALGRPAEERRWHFDGSGAPIGSGLAITSFTYDNIGRELGVIDPSGALSRTRFDGLGRPTVQLLPTGDTVRTEFLDGGHAIRTTSSAPTEDGELRRTIFVDYRGAPLTLEVDEAGTRHMMRTWKYDQHGRLGYELDVAGDAREYDYDAFGQLRRVATDLGADLDGERVTLKYDRAGRVVARESVVGRGATASEYTYDVLGRVTRVQGPTGAVSKTAYLGASGLVDVQQDERGVETRSSYDHGRLASLTAVPKDPAQTLRLSFQYDGLGRMVEARHSGKDLATATDDVVTALGWNSLGGRVYEANSVLGAPNAVRHAYDARGLPAASSFAGTDVARRFDALGRLTEITSPSTGTLATFFYAGLGGPVERVAGNGVSTRNYYDPFGRLARIDDTGPGGQELASFGWTLPLDGTPRAIEGRRGGAPFAALYGIDSRQRVTGERSRMTALPPLGIAPDTSPAEASKAVAPYLDKVDWRAYTYDGRNNWTSRGSDDPTLATKVTFDDRDAYQSFGGNVASYDQSGALVADGDLALEYDALGNVVEARRGKDLRRFAYDALGRRVTDSDGTNTVAFGYDGMSRALRKIGTQAVELTIDGQDPDEHIARIGGGTPTLFFHQDRSKSVYMVTDDSGAALEYYDYTAFGELRIFDPGGNERPSSAVGNRFGFQGHPFDVGLGLVDMRARFYRPSWGRFISPDPIGYAGGPSLYSFVGGAPLTYRDPTGLDAFRIGKYVQDQIEEFHIAMRVSRETGIPVRFGDTTYSVTDAIKDAIFDAPDNLRKFDAGLGRGLRKGAGSLWHSVTHPVETAKGMAKFILHLGSSGPTFGELLDGAWTWLNNTNPDDAAGQIGEVLGEIEFTLATAAVGGELWAYARRIWAARAATAEAAATGVAADSAAGAGQLRTVPPCQLGQVCGVGAGTGEGLGPRAAGAADAPRGVGKANAPKSTLPRDGAGNYLPDPEAQGAHTTIGTRQGRRGSYTQGATFDAEGKFRGVTDVTTHGRGGHPNPHFHPATSPNSIEHGPHPLPTPEELGL